MVQNPTHRAVAGGRRRCDTAHHRRARRPGRAGRPLLRRRRHHRSRNRPERGGPGLHRACAPDKDESVNTHLGGFPQTRRSRRSCRPRTASCSWTGTNSTPRSPPTWPRSWPTRKSRGAWTPSAETITDSAWRTKPSWYLVSTEDRMIPPAAQRTMSQRAGSTVTEVSASHSVYVSQPAATVALIRQAAAAVAARQ